MHSIAFRLLAEEFIDDEQQQMQQQRIVRRDLRDGMNPLELPQCLFEKYYRVNKPAFMYLFEMLMAKLKPAKKQFAVPPVVKLSGCLGFFFAEGGYQTGVGKDSDVALAQSSFSFLTQSSFQKFWKCLKRTYAINKLPCAGQRKKKGKLRYPYT